MIEYVGTQREVQFHSPPLRVNLSSLSPDGTTVLGPSANFVKVLVPMLYSYLAAPCRGQWAPESIHNHNIFQPKKIRATRVS